MVSSTEARQEALESMDIPKPIAQAVADTFSHAFKEYHKAGGIGALRANLARHEKPFRDALESGLHKVAVLCYDAAGGNHEKALDLFQGACAQQEAKAKRDWAKEHGEEATQNMMIILPGWTNAKTVAIKFFKAGLDIHASQPVVVDGKESQQPLYPTLAKMKAATPATGRAPRQPSVAGAPGIGSAMKTTARLSAVLKSLSSTLAQMNEAEQDEAAAIIEPILASVSAILQVRKDKEREQRHVLSAEIRGGGSPAEASVASAAVQAQRAENGRRTANQPGSRR
jgi:hypothetical protein